MWSAKSYAMERLRECGNRLRAPGKASAFSDWRTYSADQKHARSLRALAEKEAGLQGDAYALAQELAAVRAACEARLVAAEEEKRTALERQRIELTGSAEEMAALNAAKAKEERIELLRRQIGRRMMNQGIANAWSAWREHVNARAYAHTRLKQVANHLRAPGIAPAFTFWLNDMHTLKESRLAYEAYERGSLLEQEKRRAAALEREAASLRSELQELLDERSELRSKVASLDVRYPRPHALCPRTRRSLAHKCPRTAWHVLAVHTLALVPTLQTRSACIYTCRRFLCLTMLSLAARVFTPFPPACSQSGVAEVEGLRQEQLAAAKEERIELLRRQITRRMLNQGLTMGFTAWVELASSRKYAMNRLRKISNHLRAPGKARAFQVLVREWLAGKRAKEAAIARKKESAMLSSQASLADELTQMREFYEARLVAADKEKQTSLERLRVELAGTAKERAAMKIERAKEERIELMRRQVARRIMHSGLSSGFAAWKEGWRAKRAAIQRLRDVANRLKAPELQMTFAFWVRDLEQSKYVAELTAQKLDRERMRREADELASTVEVIKKQYEAKLIQSEEQRMGLMEKIVALGGGAMEAEALREAQAAKSKEERIELLRRQTLRRVMHRDLALGWNAWSELWRARSQAKKTLRKVANRLRSPEKATAFAFWRTSLEEAKGMQATTQFHQREATLKEEKEMLLGEIKRLRASFESQLKEAGEKQAHALQRQLVELTGSVDDIERLRSEKEKEERVGIMHRQMARRMANQGIASGFSAWKELYESRQYALRRLHQVGNHLRSPEMSQAFTFWSDDCRETKAAAERAELERLANSLDAQLRKARHEAGQLNLVRAANEDELKELREKLKETSAKCAEQAALLSGSQGLSLSLDELKEQHALAVANADDLTAKLQEAETDAAKQRAEAQALLERLLAEQRTRFEEDTKDTTAALKKHQGEMAVMKAAVSDGRKEVDRVNKQAEVAKADLQRTIRKLEAELEKMKKAEELRKKPKSPAPKSGGILGGIDLDEGPDAMPISEQIGGALRKNATRVLDLFRSWDEDGNGNVDRAEFHSAMAKFGLDVPKKDIDALFSEWDKGGDGSLTLRELQKILKAPPAVKKPRPKSSDSARGDPSSPTPSEHPEVYENTKTIGDAGKAVQATKKLSSAVAALGGASKALPAKRPANGAKK